MSSADKLQFAQLGTLWAGVEADSRLAPLIYTGIVGQPGPVAGVRRHLEHWATHTGSSASTVADLVLAGYEALAEAAELAYQGGEGPMDLIAVLSTDRRMLVTIQDYGRWRLPVLDSGLRGRGLTMIRALAHRVEIEESPHGTCVHMEWKVAAPDEVSGPAQDK